MATDIAQYQDPFGSLPNGFPCPSWVAENTLKTGGAVTHAGVRVLSLAPNYGETSLPIHVD
jgi:hypothetical protein